PLLRLRARPGAGLRDPRGARRGVVGPRAVAELREAATRALRDRGAAEPPTATGACPRVQDPGTPEPQETQEALIVAEGGVHFALPDPDRRHDEVRLGQEVVRPRPGPHFAWRDGAWQL